MNASAQLDVLQPVQDSRRRSLDGEAGSKPRSELALALGQAFSFKSLKRLAHQVAAGTVVTLPEKLEY
jgi:hypothetical protein